MLSGYAVANPTAVDAAQAVRELHHFLYWFYRTYSREPQAANHTKDEMQCIVDRRGLMRPLAVVEIDSSIAGFGRLYQTQGIRSVWEQFEKHRQHKPLLLMSTCTSKTRTR